MSLRSRIRRLFRVRPAVSPHIPVNSGPWTLDRIENELRWPEPRIPVPLQVLPLLRDDEKFKQLPPPWLVGHRVVS